MNTTSKTKLTPSEVMKQWKIGRTKLYQMMSDGKLSYENTSTGKRQIDLSEVVRALGEPDSKKGDESPIQSVFIVQALQKQLEAQKSMSGDYIQSLKDQLATKDEQIAKLMESLENTTKLLQHQQASPKEELAPKFEQQEVPQSELKPEASQPVKHKRSLFQRVLSAVVED